MIYDIFIFTMSQLLIDMFKGGVKINYEFCNTIERKPTKTPKVLDSTTLLKKKNIKSPGPRLSRKHL